MQQSTSLPSPLAATFAAAWGNIPGAPVSGANSGSVNGHRAGTDSVSESIVSVLREDREKEQEQDKDKERMGLGLVVQEEERTHRPSHLALSPSDGALSDQVHVVNGDEVVEEDDRGHMSEVRFSSLFES